MPAISMDEAINRYRQQVGPVNAKKNVAVVRKWLLWGGQPTDASLTAYVRELQRQGYKPGTIDGVIRTIRSFYRHLKITPPRVVGFTFDPIQDSARPALASEAMRTLMQAARDPASILDHYQRAILVLALVYGPRANELAAIQPQDVESERIYIRTSKHGTPRWFWVPESIRPLLAMDWPDVSTAYVEKQLSILWTVVFGTAKPTGIGWHAIRRGLVRDLAEAGVPDAAIGHFMRWKGKQSAEFAMLQLYANPNQTVGPDGMIPIARAESGSYAEDALVWDQHPFII